MWDDHNFIIIAGEAPSKITPAMITQHSKVAMHEGMSPLMEWEKGIIFFKDVELAQRFLKECTAGPPRQLAYMHPEHRHYLIQNSVLFWFCNVAFLFRHDGKDWIKDITEVKITM